MIKLTRALDGRTIYISKPTVAMIEEPPNSAEAGAILIVSGQRIAVRESVERVLKALGTEA